MSDGPVSPYSPHSRGSSASSLMSSPATSARGSPHAADATADATADANADARLRRSPRIKSKPAVRYVTRTRKAEERASREANRQLQALFDLDDGDEEEEEEVIEEGGSEAHASQGRATDEESAAEEASDASGEGDAESTDGSAGKDVHDSSMTRPGQVDMVEKSVDAVSVEAPQRFHDDWAAWWDYKKGYEEATFQVIRVTETLRIKTRNERARKTKAAQQGQTVVEYPESMDPFRRVFICTHGWKPKSSREDKSTGKRPRQHIRFTGCPYRFVIQVVKHGSGWRLEVMNGTYYHNHRVSKDVFQTYPSSRGVKDPSTKALVDTMIECGTKRSKIYDFLLDHGENVIRSDVNNMISAFKAQVTTRNDDDETAIALARFAAQHEGNAVTVDETSRRETGVILISSHHMREMYERFPELLLVDCTHKTNRYNYQLCTLMIMNEYGEGLPIQQSLLETNGDWHMDRVLQHFKRVNPDAESRLKVIVVDKDLNEIRVLQTHFPDARILLCTFHVIKYLKLVSRKPEFGKIATQDHSAIDNLLHAMVYAQDSEAYDTNMAALKDLCDRLHFDRFYEYVATNWNGCKDMWVHYRRSKLPHFKNHTNNRLESFFGKFKDGITADTKMAACIEAIIASARRDWKSYKHRKNTVGRNSNASYDEEMSNVLLVSTHFVAKQIEAEYALANEKFELYVYEKKDDEVVLVHHGGRLHTIGLSTWSCDCSFASSMKLPCRHVMAFRKHAGTYPSMIPLSAINQRWTKVHVDVPPVRPFQYNEFTTETVSKRTRAERYRAALSVSQAMSSDMADIEDEKEFEGFLSDLIQQWRNVRQRKRVRPTPEKEEVYAQLAEVQVSQPNSLYCADLGDVVMLDANDVHIAEPQSQVMLTQSQVVLTPLDTIAEVERGDEMVSGAEVEHRADVERQAEPENEPEGDDHGRIMEGHGLVVEDAKPTAREDAKPTALDSSATTPDDADDNPDADDNSVQDADDNSVPDHSTPDDPALPKIRLNPRAAKTGRPKLDKQTRESEEKQQRVVFRASQDAKARLGEVTLKGFLDGLLDEKPPVEEALRRLCRGVLRFRAVGVC